MAATRPTALFKTIPEVSVRLVRDQEVPYGEVVFDGAASIARFLHNYATGLDREHFFVLLLNGRRKLVAFSVVSIGTIDAAMVHPREVFKVAILHNATSIVVAHNHPCGDSSPSPEDIDLTRKLVDAGRLLMIPVLDHIVLGAGSDFVSIRGYFPGFF